MTDNSQKTYKRNKNWKLDHYKEFSAFNRESDIGLIGILLIVMWFEQQLSDSLLNAT